MVRVFKFDLETNNPLSVISLVAGVIFSPHATNLIKPLEYAGSEVGRELTYFCIECFSAANVNLRQISIPLRCTLAASFLESSLFWPVFSYRADISRKNGSRLRFSLAL